MRLNVSCRLGRNFMREKLMKWEKERKNVYFQFCFRGKNKQQQFLLNQKKNIYWF